MGIKNTRIISKEKLEELKIGKNLKDTPSLQQQLDTENSLITGNSANIPLMSQNIVYLQQTVGNQAVGKLIRKKLKVGHPGDEFEHEADRVADEIIQKPESASNQQKGMNKTKPPAIQKKSKAKDVDIRRQEIDEEEQRKRQEEESVHYKEQTGETPCIPDNIESQISSLHGKGKSLPESERNYYESQFGKDFRDVKIHKDPEAAKTAQALHARAFTKGQDIVFNKGEFAPGTSEGKKLLTHELTHVVQQETNTPSIQRQPQNDDDKNDIDIFDRIGFFLMNPDLEQGAIQTALQELDTSYKPHVKIEDVEFRKLSNIKVAGFSRYFKWAQSIWEGNKPVIELTDSTITEYKKYESDPKANRHNGHNFIRVIGHEMYHLYRQKLNHSENPLQAPFEKEYEHQMKKVQQNWLDKLKKTRPGLKKWEDIPEKERLEIEQGAAETYSFQELYYRTAYLVEEIYAKLEELTYLRIEQKLETDEKLVKMTRTELLNIEKQIAELWGHLEANEDNFFLTRELIKKTKERMEIYIRNRYGKRRKEPFELLLFRKAVK